mmetsp:Transcript_52467/g.111810  ORF Transcript_52467/g.111810 Transcript_52467/m.111810 type:complete len:218 (-) Transcript_52467:91-744(-)
MLYQGDVIPDRLRCDFPDRKPLRNVSEIFRHFRGSPGDALSRFATMPAEGPRGGDDQLETDRRRTTLHAEVERTRRAGRHPHTYLRGWATHRVQSRSFPSDHAGRGLKQGGSTTLRRPRPDRNSLESPPGCPRPCSEARATGHPTSASALGRGFCPSRAVRRLNLNWYDRVQRGSKDAAGYGTPVDAEQLGHQDAHGGNFGTVRNRSRAPPDRLNCR